MHPGERVVNQHQAEKTVKNENNSAVKCYAQDANAVVSKGLLRVFRLEAFIAYFQCPFVDQLVALVFEVPL